MTDLNDYANRTPGAAPAAGVGGGKPGTCASCNAGSTSTSAREDDDDYYYQRIPLFEPIPAAESPPAEGRDFVVKVDHRSDWFEPKSMFMEVRNLDGSINHFAYIQAYRVGEDREDCITSKTPRGIPVHAYSVQGGCCDGLKIAVRPFESQKENEYLNIEVRVFGGAAGVIQGYVRGRCRNCGYEKYCRGDKSEVQPG